MRLFQGDPLAGSGIKHAEHNCCDLAALDAAGRMEGTQRVGADGDTGAVEFIDLCTVFVSRLHIGDLVVGNSVDGRRVDQSAAEDVDKLTAGRRSVHLRPGIVQVVLLDDPVVDGIRDVAVIPVRCAVGQGHAAGLLHLVQGCRQLDGLRHGQLIIWPEFVGGNAVDQAVLPGRSDAIVVPARGRNVGEREFGRVVRSIGLGRLRRDRDDRPQQRCVGRFRIGQFLVIADELLLFFGQCVIRLAGRVDGRLAAQRDGSDRVDQILDRLGSGLVRVQKLLISPFGIGQLLVVADEFLLCVGQALRAASIPALLSLVTTSSIAAIRSATFLAAASSFSRAS